MTTGTAWQGSSSFINAILCTEDPLQTCYAEYDEIGTLKPNIPEITESSKDTTTDEENFFARYTWYCEDICENNPRNIDSWLALEYLLLISCLPTDPAKDIWYDVQ